ncbi:MAG: DUF5011 domain-containing protein [Cocleimonas sp.]|nr:DUF5011 domain-containing protein [Cocleimonas sp.]
MNISTIRRYLSPLVLLLGVFFILGSEGGTSPSITLLGSTPVKIIQGEEYIDAGAMAKDSEGVELTVTTVGLDKIMPTSSIGTYIIYYTAIDSTANKVTAEREVSIVAANDKTPPEIKDLNKPTLSTRLSLKYSLIDLGSGIDSLSIKPKITTAESDSNHHDISQYYFEGTLFLNIKLDLSVASPTLQVELEVADKSGNKIKKQFNYLLDDEVPEIILTGKNPTVVIKGTKYIDAGATVLDNVDQNLMVTSTGSVDTSTLGKYMITYSAIDQQGNKTYITRNIYVIAEKDEEPPQIKDVTIEKTDREGVITVDPDSYLRYSLTDSGSGIDMSYASEGLEKIVQINGETPHIYDVSYDQKTNMLYIKKDHLDEFGGHGDWDLGILTIEINVSDSAGNQATKVFNYTVATLNTIAVTPYSSLLSREKLLGIEVINPELGQTIDFSFEAKADNPIVRYQWSFHEEILNWYGSDVFRIKDTIYNISKRVDAKKIVTKNTYTEPYAYKASPTEYSLLFIRLKVTDSKGYYGNASMLVKLPASIIPLGNNPINIEQGAVYSDASFVWSSLFVKEDVRVSNGGLVDTNITGEHVLVYSVKDEKSNVQPTKRIINVIPSQAYQCKSTTLTESKFVDFTVDQQPLSHLLRTQSLSVTDIEKIFSTARQQDDSVEEINLKLPKQAVWDNYTSAQKALYLINSERCARGLRPFEGVEPKVSLKPAQYYADYLANKELYSHHADFNSPEGRLLQYAGIQSDSGRLGHNADNTAHWDWRKEREAIAMIGLSSTIDYPVVNSPVVKAVYNWLYNDKTSHYTNRGVLLRKGLRENSRYAAKEGLIGLGIASKKTEQLEGAVSRFLTTYYLVLNVFDPNKQWDMQQVKTVDLIAPY